MVFASCTKQVFCSPYEVRIFVGGNYEQAQEICRSFCSRQGACVTVSKTEYIYTGGQEKGVIIGLINYPRFPKAPVDIFQQALALANDLLVGLHQTSLTIWAPDGTTWLTRRKDDN